MNAVDQALFRELVESTNDLVISLDSAGRFRYASPSIEKALGIEPAECIGAAAISLVHQDDQKRTLKNYRNWIRYQYASALLETRVIGANGEIRHFMWTVTLNYAEDGSVSVVNAIGRDATTIKRTEEKLRRNEEMWNKLFMASPTWIVLVTLDDGIIMDLNDPFCHDTGYRKEEVIGRTTKEIGLWPDPDDRDEILKIIKKTGSLDRLPLVLRMKNGDLRDFLWSTVVIEVRGRQCLLSVLVDVSELRKTEKELAEANMEIRERSNDLAEMNAALKVLLKQREEDKAELESRVMHNIKNMIQPHLRNLQTTGLNNTQLAHLDVAISRMSDIASRLGESLGRRTYGLTARELEITGHIIEGKTNKDIAEILNISVHSVESHRFSIRKKLGLLGKKINLRSHLMGIAQPEKRTQLF